MSVFSFKLMFGVYSLACGDVGGRLNGLFSRVQSIQKKSGQFDVSQIPNNQNFCEIVSFLK